MDKISGIIPANARTKSADVSRSQPVRPGAPTYGRPEGRVTTQASIEDKFLLSSVDRQAPPVTYKNPAETARVKIVSDLARNFFEGKAPPQAPATESSVAPDLSSVKPLSSNEDSE